MSGDDLQVGDLVIAPVFILDTRAMTLGIYKGVTGPWNNGRLERRRMDGSYHETIENLFPKPDRLGRVSSIDVPVAGLIDNFGTNTEQKSCIRKATITDVLLLNTLNSLGLLGARGSSLKVVNYDVYNNLINPSMQGQGTAGDPLTLPVPAGAAMAAMATTPKPPTILDSPKPPPILYSPKPPPLLSAGGKPNHKKSKRKKKKSTRR